MIMILSQFVPLFAYKKIITISQNTDCCDLRNGLLCA